MVRTQIYLTENEKTALGMLSVRLGKNQSELIRVALDDLLARFDKSHRHRALDRFAGIWRDREDLPKFNALRREWDRG